MSFMITFGFASTRYWRSPTSASASPCTCSTRGATQGDETVGGSSCGGELSPGRRSTKMISYGRTDTKCKVLIERLGENLLPTAQAWKLRRPGPPVAAPGTGNRHTDLLCYLWPGQALVTEFPDLLCRRGVSPRTAATHRDAGTAKLMAHRGPCDVQLGTDLPQGPAGQALVTEFPDLLCRRGVSPRTAATHRDAGTAKLMAHRGPCDVQLGTDLPQGPALGVQIGRPLNVHGATVASLSRIVFPPIGDAFCEGRHHLSSWSIARVKPDELR